jgi:hypothetical protein
MGGGDSETFNLPACAEFCVRHVAVKGMIIDRVVDGKWKDSRILMDALGLLHQLGALPPAPPSAT